MTTDYTSTLVAIFFGAGFSLLFLVMAMFLGPKRGGAVKLSPFECGSEPIGTPRTRFSVKFYQVAILFLIFDIEAAFLYPFTTTFHEGPSFFLLVELLVFVGTLVAALAYVWRKRAIGWG